MKVTVLLRKNKICPKGTAPLYIRISQNTNRKEFVTPFRIEPKFWNDETDSVRKTHPLSKEINTYLTATITNIEKIVISKMLQGDTLQFNEVLERVGIGKAKKTNKEGCNDVFYYFKCYVSELKAEGRLGNAKYYRQVCNILQSYHKKKTLSFEDITPQYIKAFETHLLKSVKPITVNSYFRAFKAIINKAIEQKITLIDNPFLVYKPNKRNITTDKRSISIDQLKEIIAHPTQSIAKDVFLLSFYLCGINFNDLCKLTKGDIINNTITYTRSKTHKSFNIPLPSEAKTILDKYFDTGNNYLLPILNSSKNLTAQSIYNKVRKTLYEINTDLKQIGSDIGISIDLTTYVARHTFATLHKYNGTPTALISEMLGHSSEKITRIYLKAFDVSHTQTANNSLFQKLNL